MDKEAVVHIYNEILLSYKKGHIWVSSNEVDKLRAYDTEYSKSEKEKQILYICAYISVLMRWINLEPMIQSKVNQKKKNKYCILVHIYRIWKDDTDESAHRAAVEMQT